MFLQPTVMVVASPDAEAIFKRNGVSAAEFLRPFGKFTDINSTLMTNLESQSSATIRHMNLRFVSPSEVKSTPPDAADKVCLCSFLPPSLPPSPSSSFLTILSRL